MFAKPKNLISLVEAGPTRFKNYVVSLCYTQFTELCSWIVGGGSGDNAPVNIILDILIFQATQVSTQLSCCTFSCLLSTFLIFTCTRKHKHVSRSRYRRAADKYGYECAFFQFSCKDISLSRISLASIIYV